MKKFFLKVIPLFAAIFSIVGFSSGSVLSNDLKVALAAEPTSMDPHYQNLTINQIRAAYVKVNRIQTLLN